ncbi:DUF4268 domain-containing protein [archaeon]|jgi:hypothetical protein|nr:DUF4268 domain-containing protein [archaeon]
MKLSSLKQVQVRKQWPDEAKDFTPWLASEEGLALLGESLGMELQLEDTEVMVGNYRADIVAKDSVTNEYVVIENQLSATNHDHIGKLFTYSASFGASTLIWIAESLREEHRQAIDWFNDITTENVDFYGIEIELFQIGQSDYAPHLKMVSKPNESTRTIRAEKTKLTEGGSKNLEFWSHFNEHIKAHSNDIRMRKPQPNHWYDIAIGKSGVHITLCVRFTWGNDISCELYISRGDDKEFYHQLHAEKEKFEGIIGSKLEWNELPEGKSSRIISRKKLDPNSRESWEKCFNWYVNSTKKFKEAFIPYVSKL